MKYIRRNLIFSSITLLMLLGCNPSVDKSSNDVSDSKTENNASPNEMYIQLQERLLQGWNTWDNRSVLTYVLMPEKYGLVLGLEDLRTGDYAEHFFTGNRVIGSEEVRTIAHTPDGSFTHLTMNWQNNDIRVRTSSQGNDLHIIVSPDSRNAGVLHVNGRMIYGDTPAEVTIQENQITLSAENSVSTFYVQGTTAGSEKSDGLTYSLDYPVYISTRDMSIEEIRQTIDEKEKEWFSMKEFYGGRYSEAAEVYSAIQNAVNWNVVYDDERDRVVTPVARTWAYGWGKGEPGGYVLFCWDNYFAAWMHAIESKDLAFNEAIQMTNYIDELGFVPNYAGPGDIISYDRSQPPVGGMCIKKIYEMHPEKWFLEYNFDKLMTWNRFWDERRNIDGLLTWGSDPFEPEIEDNRLLVQNEFKAASNESGLDNTPMYDGVQFNKENHLLKIQDVGLTGLYLMDCHALLFMAEELGRTEEKEELQQRIDLYTANMQELWDEDFGMFLNRHTDTGELSKRISPTNFYALNGKAATQEQAKTMMVEHFYNPEEFWGEYMLPSIARNDTAYTGQDYWRGSIWAPMNLLVYWGMQNYNLPQAKQDIAEKSKNLLLKNWIERRWIRENYHADTGDFNPRSEHFYHWGALLGMIYLVEEGYIE